MCHFLCIDQHLEGSRGFGNEMIIFCSGLDESTEHHHGSGTDARLRTARMPWPWIQARRGPPVPFPGIGDGMAEHAEPFFPYRRQQGLLVGKMPV